MVKINSKVVGVVVAVVNKDGFFEGFISVDPLRDALPRGWSLYGYRLKLKEYTLVDEE